MVYIGSKRNADVCLYFKFLLNPRDASYFLRDNLIITDYLHTFFAVNKFTDNNSKAYGLERAKNAGIATKVIRKNADCGGDNDEFNRQICAYMKEMDVDVIVLAGFLAILGGDLLKEYANKIVNIHPSLIPSFCGDGFYGLKVHQAALDYGVKVTGG